MDCADHSSKTGRVATVAFLIFAALVALALRTYRTDVPFHTGDYASMPYMVSHWYGISWIIAHIHGPLLPAIVWLFAKFAIAVGLVMDETMWRLPLALVGTIQVPVTYLLMRRLRAGRWVAILAAAIAAALPSLTSDARYPWGYETLAVCVGSLAIWAWLRDLDHSTRGSRWLAGGLLGLYLVSHLVIHAVPLVIVAAMLLATGWRGTVRRLLRASTLIPVSCAVAVILFAFFHLNGGILGRMNRHIAHGTLETGSSSVLDIAHYWNHHMGPIWSAFCLVAVLVGLVLVARRDRRGLPALWAVLYVTPLLLLLDLSNIGRPTVYQVQGTYAASLAGCMFLQILAGACARQSRSLSNTAQSPSVAPVGGCGLRDPASQGSLRFALGFIPSPLRGYISLVLRGCISLALGGWSPVNKTTLRCTVKAALRGGLIAFGIVIVAMHLTGSTSNLFLTYRWPVWTGTVDYGRAVADPGFKAAGWYVREHVPPDALILATHGVTGMEYPCATYYTGRHVAASEDTTYDQECRIIEAVRGDIDVAIVEPRYLSLFTRQTGFTVPVRIRRGYVSVLYIVASHAFDIPEMDVAIECANADYDRLCHLTGVPTMIPDLPRTAAVNQTILALLRAPETKSLSQNCGTGVSPVVHHGRDARATEGFGIGSKRESAVATAGDMD